MEDQRTRPLVDTRLLLESHTLERLHLGARRAFGMEAAYVCDQAEWEHFRDEELMQLVYTLKSEVLGERLAEQTVEVSGRTTHTWWLPESWWQMFKMAHSGSRWLGWFVRRHPARECPVTTTIPWSRKVRTEQFATFPAATIHTPATLRGPVIVRHERTVVVP